ncbi:MAG: 16S rRNA (guanine(966)-N(2))-methyltransferase RsmD [Deltaproteobacteria bacterium]|nr:MAG: 16S rRNA (guanine(966)-N(2))-methyltransferase RsmD [Deltaproteobacteria bacterium]
MRISGGRLRGREVRVPRLGQVRPTSARVREALFSIVGQELDGWRTLDAFAGAGLLGLEAASRGAGPVLFTDRDPAVVRHLRRTVAALVPALADGVVLEVRRLDAAAALRREGGFDLVLLDPPYAEDPVHWLSLAAPATRRVLALEHRWGCTLPPTAASLRLHRHRRYGDTGLAVYTA